jgi:hypothetical protein
MADDIDSIVKGAPAAPKAAADTAQGIGAGKQGDPLNHTPSSPSMIYLNLLILEASLRAQYLELRARRRHHTIFITILTLWVAYFTYELRFAEREDGEGFGGSIYWAVEGFQKVCLMGGIVTAILIWATGIWDRGIRWPRRWFVISNRGLRGFNCKLVVTRRSWWAEALSTTGFFLTYGLFSHNASSSYRHVDPHLLREVDRELQLSRENHPALVPPPDYDERQGFEEDLAPGGDYVKLLLLAKPFSATFRENWELYRTEYWEKENERRALLRRKVKEHDKRLIKQHYRWFWWLPWLRAPTAHSHLHKTTPQRFPSVEKERRRRGSSVRRSSISSTRSQTPMVDTDEGQISRRPSAASATAPAFRRKKAASLSKPKRPGMGTESRSVTPDIPSPLARESSAAKDEPVAPVAAAEGTRVLRSSSVRASPAPTENT